MLTGKRNIIKYLPLIGHSCKFSTTTNDQLAYKLNPYYITGFVANQNIPEKQCHMTCFVDGESLVAIVVWGTNLLSMVGKGRITKQESSMIQLPPYQYSVVIGLLLSDGWLTYSNSRSKNARLGFLQSGANSSYVWYVFNILSHYCSPRRGPLVPEGPGREVILFIVHVSI